MTCAFTGHRPQRLPWGSREDDPRCRALKLLLASTVAQAADAGFRHFLCGMARGCDTYFAETVLQIKMQRPEFFLEAVVPCPGQADRWPPADRQRYGQLLQRCDRVTVLEDAFSDGCMQRRNRAMVDRADRLITVWDGTAGGTGSTVAYAKGRGVEIIPLWV